MVRGANISNRAVVKLQILERLIEGGTSIKELEDITKSGCYTVLNTIKDLKVDGFDITSESGRKGGTRLNSIDEATKLNILDCLDILRELKFIEAEDLT